MEDWASLVVEIAIWKLGGGAKRTVAAMQPCATFRGSREPVHGGSWSFGLGSVSHVGGDAAGREIFPDRFGLDGAAMDSSCVSGFRDRANRERMPCRSG